MVSFRKVLSASAFVCLSLSLPGLAQQENAKPLQVDWQKVTITSRTTPTLQVVVNPQLLRGAMLHDPSFKALHDLGADYVRYVPWLPYPKQAVAELEPPKDGKTSWDFSHIDPTLEDFMKATDGHSVVMNFSTIPAWMYKTDKPVTYPADPNQVFWNYTQGTELRDPSMKEVSDYFVRLLSWYTKGGFTDEYGKRHESGHHYKIAYWELLNEIDFEHHWTPEQYTKFYDVVTTAMLKVDPDLKFMALALAAPSKDSEMFEYFLNPANHHGGAPLDFITYHFYAGPAPKETIENWQYTFFNQEEGFLNTVRYVEAIRKRLSPKTKTDLNELGVILPEDGKSNRIPGYAATPEPAGYWNLAGAMYADLYVQLARMGVDVAGESQLVGYPTQYPSVSMMNYKTGEPNARFWTLKLLKDNFGPGDKLADTQEDNRSLSVQAFQTSRGRKILIVNKRLKQDQLTLPKDFKAAHITYVAPWTGDKPPASKTFSGDVVTIEPNEVAVISE
ncbi:glycosyl hydrolase family 39 [Edaphobacter sp. 12200R-103]|uniref:GH39 family glycosyl hydrolase n=1 Tax=Edaphobacter sp. 12200R-103 TaxID=2703788 RepID=UPI00138C8FE2|nr:glycosyl hydrolase family 39 [Edaphobacter sp. 12200R-103]QHS51064.1 glycosyl hydrolase family 39 [Edaphobacter sp. 12200R-103]